MNNYDFLLERKRRQSLFIVEGNHEKNELIYLLLQIFPQIDIKEEDIIIYGTNIYMLYEDIENEYTSEWDAVDVDLAYVVSKKKQLERTLNKDDFNNIVLIFDYERHDPNFSEEKIVRLQRYFSDSTDVGKLYINYPMVEAYQHFDKWPDDEYLSLSIPVTLNPGIKYKRLVRESFVSKLANLPIKLEEILKERFNVNNNDVRKVCVQSLLALSEAGSLHESVREILMPALQEKDLSTAEYQIVDILSKCAHIGKNQTYFDYLRQLFSAIIIQSICKAKKICGDTYDISKTEMKEVFFSLDLGKVLLKQNISSRDIEKGIIWVLNTCILFVADYKFDLIDF